MTEISESVPILEMPRDVYLNRLVPEDRENLKRVASVIEEVLKEQNITGNLYVVGGSITKPNPRPDIDLVLRLNKTPNDEKDPTITQFDRAIMTWTQLQEILKKVTEKDPTFAIDQKKSFHPSINKEFGNPSILEHDGSVGLKPETGAIIEFVNVVRKGTQKEVIESSKRPYVVLASV